LKETLVQLDPTTLLILWFGGGFVIVLIWAALIGEALMGNRPAAVRVAMGALAVIGVFHPMAAIGAVDLVRFARTMGTPPTDAPSSPSEDQARSARSAALTPPRWVVTAVYICALASAFVTTAALIEAGVLT
jgi:hypothetical protein